MLHFEIFNDIFYLKNLLWSSFDPSDLLIRIEDIVTVKWQ